MKTLINDFENLLNDFEWKLRNKVWAPQESQKNHFDNLPKLEQMMIYNILAFVRILNKALKEYLNLTKDV